MDTAIRDQWVEALLSGKYHQTKAVLRNESGYCCLGVLCDIVKPDILDRLRRIAPLTAVRGNNDRGDWARSLPEYDVVEFGAIAVYVRHDRAELDIDPLAAGFRVLVFGHSHQPSVESREGVLYVNPGSAGPRRFKLPVAVGELEIEGDRVAARIIELRT